MKTMETRLLMLFFFMFSVSFAQVTSYEEYDTNTDGITDQEEFLTATEADFETWDADGDGTINDREFYDTTFNRLDEDGDRNLSEEEWNNGYNHLFGAHMQGELNRNENAPEKKNKVDKGKGHDKGNHGYSAYDLDRDGMVSSAEFYNGLTNSYYYTTYDANQDGAVDRDELFTTTFLNMDENKDGNLDQNEYDTYSGYYID